MRRSWLSVTGRRVIFAVPFITASPMDTLLSVISLIAAFLLVLVVIIQPGKADMISGMSGLGGQMTNLFGVRQSRNVLQTATMVLLGVIAVFAILINSVFLDTSGGAQRESVAKDAPQPTLPAPTRQAPQPSQQPAQQPAPASAPAGK
ncbi:MAG TPA: preprotein translocase subunit SecG [Bacteroidetes bacterium]|nr:preprotein translocase subunit SecG [Bacteroidota bacterium]